MIYITEQQVKDHLTLSVARDVLLREFISHAGDRVDILPQSRAGHGFHSISAAGALLYDSGVSGITALRSSRGERTSCIVLFDDCGSLNTVVEASEIRRIGKQALTALAAQFFARPAASTLGLMGECAVLGLHARSVLESLPISRVLVATETTQRLLSGTHADCYVASAEEIATSSDVILFACRASAPLDTSRITAGTLVIAIGGHDDGSCVVNEGLLRRASRVIVERVAEGVAQAPELRCLSLETLSSLALWDLGHALIEPRTAHQRKEDITFFRSVGIGLSDIALAHHVAESLTSPV